MADVVAYRVILSEAVIQDLSDIGRWVAERADIDTANGYVARIEAFAQRLSHFPNRGTPRFDLARGLRTVTFERTIIIAYRVAGEDVIIQRALHTSRDYRDLLRT
jgi:toxin ParE1/3/4